MKISLCSFTDGRTDRASYRDARTHLKRENKSKRARVRHLRKIEFIFWRQLVGFRQATGGQAICRTDTPSYIYASSHLKIIPVVAHFFLFSPSHSHFVTPVHTKHQQQIQYCNTRNGWIRHQHQYCNRGKYVSDTNTNIVTGVNMYQTNIVTRANLYQTPIPIL